MKLKIKYTSTKKFTINFDGSTLDELLAAVVAFIANNYGDECDNIALSLNGTDPLPGGANTTLAEAGIVPSDLLCVIEGKSTPPPLPGGAAGPSDPAGAGASASDPAGAGASASDPAGAGASASDPAKSGGPASDPTGAGNTAPAGKGPAPDPAGAGGPAGDSAKPGGSAGDSAKPGGSAGDSAKPGGSAGDSAGAKVPTAATAAMEGAFPPSSLLDVSCGDGGPTAVPESLSQALSLCRPTSQGQLVNLLSHITMVECGFVPTGPTVAGTSVPPSPMKTGTKDPSGPVETGTKDPSDLMETVTKDPSGPVETGTKDPSDHMETGTKDPASPMETETKDSPKLIETGTNDPPSPMKTETSVPSGAKCPGAGVPLGWKDMVANLSYTHRTYAGFSCTLVLVSMGGLKQILVAFPQQDVEISTKVSVADYADDVEYSEARPVSVEDLRNVAKFAQKLRNELLLPLQLAAHRILGLPSPSHLAGLPSEVLLHILRRLEVRAVLNVSETCRRLHDVCCDDALWQALYRRDLGVPPGGVGAGPRWLELYKERYQQRKSYNIGWEMPNHPQYPHPGVYPPPRIYPFHPTPPGYPQYPQPVGPYPGVPDPSHPPLNPYTDPDSPYYGGDIPNHPPYAPLSPLGPGLEPPINPLGPDGRDPFNPFGDPQFGGLGPTLPRRPQGPRRPGGGPGFRFI